MKCPGTRCSRFLAQNLALRVEATGLEHLPAEGRCLVVANHPTGIADGVVLFELLRRVRRDMTFFANRDAIRVAPGLADVVIPVEWVEEKRTRERSRETLRSMTAAFREERCVVLFPSGRLARATLRGLRERPWTTTAVNLARRYDAPIVPLHVSGANSLLYYVLWQLSEELRNMTLFRELLNKRKRRYRVRVGAPVHEGELPESLAEATELLRAHVEDGLPAGHVRYNPARTQPPWRSEPMSDPKPTSSDEPEVQREHSMDDATTVRYLILLVGGMVALAVIIFVGVNTFV
jgi:putative hemolysin